MSEKKTITVRDVMKTNFHMIDGKATIAEAVKMMKDNRTSMLFVDKFNENDE